MKSAVLNIKITTFRANFKGKRINVKNNKTMSRIVFIYIVRIKINLIKGVNSLIESDRMQLVGIQRLALERERDLEMNRQILNYYILYSVVEE